MHFESTHPDLLKILLVDDTLDNLLVLRNLVEEFGYPYDTAVSAAEAISKIQTSRYACVLLDIQMPEMNGFEVTKFIRDFESKSGSTVTPIVAVTAHTISGTKAECLVAGMDDYITKPIDPQHLQKLLDKHCNVTAS